MYEVVARVKRQDGWRNHCLVVHSASGWISRCLSGWRGLC